jgi:monofunctional biosynthetic peptidoglycan transglycosylase
MVVNIRPDSATSLEETMAMPRQAETPREAIPPGGKPKGPVSLVRLLRHAIRLVFGLVLLWGLAVILLGLAYRVAPPISTLMLGRWLTLRPVERTAIHLDEVSPLLPLAVLTSEDARFCEHSGVDWDALQDVIDGADEDGPSRGASTIAMQTAKNLFLWPSRSYIRKGLELPIALYIDFIWPKRRLMMNYLNIAEWGDGIFGAEAASQRYFGKPAKALTRREAALLATALPNPIVRNPARPTRRHRALAARLIARMAATEPYASCLKG